MALGCALLAAGCGANKPQTTSTASILSPAGTDSRIAALYKLAAVRARADCTAGLTDQASRDVFFQKADEMDYENLLEIASDRYHDIVLDDSVRRMADVQTRDAIAAYHKRMQKIKHDLMRG